MSKSLSLMLSAVLLAGSAATAAPLAQKVSAARQGRQTATEKISTPVKGPRVLKKALSSARMNRLPADESGKLLRHRSAIKSATAASSRSIASNINLRALISFSTAWPEGEPGYGMYTVPTSEGGQFELITPMETDYNYGAVDMGDGSFWGVNFFSFFGMTFISLDQYETEGWTITRSLSGEIPIVALDTALDPSTGDVYGCYYNEDGSAMVWAKGDYSAGTSQPLGSVPEALYGVGATAAGQYYGMGKSGNLYKIDKTNGSATLIGDTGLATTYITSGCVNDANNTFLYAVSTDDGGWLYEIDLATAEPTLLVTFPNGEEIAGLYIAKPAAADKAPAAPELEAVCEGGSMDVKLTLTMPATLFDGTPATGQTFNYSIKAGDKEVATGFAAAGKTVVRTITMTESGETKFIATVSNGDGVSPKAKASCYVGKGSPAAPSDVRLTWADGKATLTWSPVTASADGGYVDPAAVTYAVLSSDDELLAAGLTSTTWSVSVAEPADSYKTLAYSVKAEYDGKQSAAAPSNAVGLGAYNAPMSMPLTGDDAAANFPQHIVLDADGNGNTWAVGNESVRYRYHNTDAADDWLFSPAINMEAGKIYTFKATLHASSDYYPERIEIKAGMGTTPADMTIILAEPTELGADDSELTALIKPAVSGRYNIGFHAISDPDEDVMTLVGYEVGAPMAQAAPDVCTDIVLTPDATGALKTNVRFTAPRVDLAGNALSGNVAVKVLRGDTEIKTLSGKPGMNYSFTDEVPLADTYTYTFVASTTAAGEGMPASASIFIGPKTPAAVSSALLKVTGENTLELTWEPVTTDEEGNPLPEGNVVKYNVYSVIIAEDGLELGQKLTPDPLAATTFTCTAELPEEQGFYYLALEPVNGTVSGGIIAPSTVVGTPYEMPVVYTDEASLENHFMYYGGTTTLRGTLSLSSADKFGIPAADGDDCHFLISHTNDMDALGTKTYISTGKILISGDYPVLSYYEYNVVAESENETVVSVICDGEETVLTSYVSGQLPVVNGWNKVKVDLSAYKGKVVMLRIGSVLRSHLYNMFDCIEVKNNCAQDLGAEISAPAEVASGEQFEVTVNVTNEGALESTSASVDLLRDGKVVETKTIAAIAPGATLSVAFTQTLSKPDVSAEYSAKVTYAADGDMTNNTTGIVTVSRTLSDLPGVTGLTATRGESSVSLTWDAIDKDHLPADAQTSDFESATSWNHEVVGWTFIDNDGSPVGGFRNMDLPGITPGETTASFFVFDCSEPGLEDESFLSHSGSKYLASLFRYDDDAVDDWAISPELSGDAQTVSFWAKSFSDDYPETIEILCSTTDTDIASFTVVTEASEVSGEWTLYSAKLPAGAKYFAIHSFASGSFMLMIDDVTFAPAGGVSTLEHVGYNVYRDGVKINDAPLTATSFVDAEAGEGAHTYHVAAVYNRGESEFSEPASVEEAGIEAVIAGGIQIAVEGSEIVVTGAADNVVTVAAVDGKVVYSAAGDARIPVACGIYLVTVDGKTVKLIVK